MDYVKKLTSELVEKILSKGVRDMPQNPAAQGYNERQIREFYYLPEKLILEILMEMDNSLKEIFDDIKKNEATDPDTINKFPFFVGEDGYIYGND